MSIAHPLDRLVQQDTFQEIIALLEPEELVVAALRLEGLSDAQIGALLDITREAVGLRLRRACQRIIQLKPDLAPLLRGRRQSRLRPLVDSAPPLERGWLCREALDGEKPLSEPTADWTVQEVARRYGVTPQTVRRWIRAGRFSGAYRLGGGQGRYRIPDEDG
ncbi:MAG: helix-turn-helix domain-containing protein [Anaerolineae bacterium]